MRSSKQRSRSKQNRNRSVGNVVNRVFDSSGPEGKVRGTPQQIIDKYNQLARDSQLSGDRVATENFQQHSEHYTRMLAEAMKEQEARREAQDAQQRERQQHQQQQRNDRSSDQRDDSRSDNRPDGRSDNRNEHRNDRRGDRSKDQGAGDQPDIASQPQPDTVATDPASTAGSDVIEMTADADSGLVETPESKPAPKPRTRRPRKPKAEPDAGEVDPAAAAE